jgi:hypothetical protein
MRETTSGEVLGLYTLPPCDTGAVQWERAVIAAQLIDETQRGATQAFARRRLKRESVVLRAVDALCQRVAKGEIRYSDCDLHYSTFPLVDSSSWTKSDIEDRMVVLSAQIRTLSNLACCTSDLNT